jgi:hypothetical protein
METLASALASPVVPAFAGNNVVAMTSHGSDKNLMVRFFVEPVYMEAKSNAAGRAIFEDQNFVHIFAPGAKTDYITRVQMEDRMDVPSHPHRFTRQWAQFQAQQEQVADGTPLEMCAFMAKHRVMELKAQRIFTAEQYAQLPDSILQNLGMGARREKELCKAYISEDEKVQALSKATAERDELKTEIELLRQQVAALANQTGQPVPEIAVQGQGLRRRPGRPKKENENAV